MVMKSALYAVISDDFGHPTLNPVTNIGYKLKEVRGDVTSCESKVSNGTSYLNIGLTDFNNKEWFFETNMPIPTGVGDRLRVFYEEIIGDEVKFKAYELFKHTNQVIRRGKLENIEFIF